MPSFNYYASQNPGALDVLKSQKFNYGTTPEFSVVEQNQTYLAYWNGVGGTGPEYIDGTAYFIKYLIDTEGNVINPEPFESADSIEAVGLYNLLNNFEVGKNATVKLIEPDPTLNSIPNAEILQGSHRIAHVGRIVPVLVSETGEDKSDYITTMSFGPIPTVTPTPNVSAFFRYSGNEYDIDEEYYVAIDFDQYLDPTTSAWSSVSSNTKRIESSSIATGTRIRFKIDLYLEETWNNNNFENTVFIRIKKNGVYVSIFNDRMMTGPQGGATNQIIKDGEGGVYTTGWSSYFDYDENDTYTVEARVANDANNKTIKVKGVGGGRNQSIWYVQQETPAGSTASPYTFGVNATTSSYFPVIINSPVTSSVEGNGGYSIIFFNQDLNRIYDTDLIQNLDPASSTFGFSPINIPFSDIKPGDFIRFEYNKNQTHVITKIDPSFSASYTVPFPFPITVTYGPYLAIYVSPSLSSIEGVNNQPMEADHFVIYRVLNDGVYVTLDVKKDAPGGAFTGILQPEFISKELTEKYDKIIQDLTSKEIIQ